MKRIGIFGGSFNPIHMGHLILAERVREARSLDRVIFVPAGRPPHKPEQPMAAPAHRLAMVRLAIAGNPVFDSTSVELDRSGPSYTLMTVRHVRESLSPATRLFLILGGDSMRDIHTWWHVETLLREAEIICFDRPGFPAEDAIAELAERYGREWAEKARELKVDGPLLAISATDIRRRISAGLSVRYMVPETVCAYIREHGLYASRPS
jgi:nicotinate-nucleotide adenylyltransferase